MQKEYWLHGWEKVKKNAKDPLFHQKHVTKGLIAYYSFLNLKPNSPILIPLCGKTKDMLWLQQQGHKITGIELSPIACRDFFKENGLSFKKKRFPHFEQYESDSIKLLCADIFDINPKDIPDFNAIYDRSALVAFPPIMREAYARYLTEICITGTKILLIAFESDNCEAYHPPFPVHQLEIRSLFGDYFNIKQLDSNTKQIDNNAITTVYLLNRR